jgi:hypothetical protein
VGIVAPSRPCAQQLKAGDGLAGQRGTRDVALRIAVVDGN